MIWVAIGCMAAVESLLIWLIIQQQKFHVEQTKALVDRLMSRDITEFKRAENPPPPRVVIKREEPTEDLGRILG
jgi:hypothetical protein